MGINGIGNHFDQSGVYGATSAQVAKSQERAQVEDARQGNMVVTEARSRVSFAVATPQLADAMNLTFDERQEYLRSVEEKAASSTLNLGKKSVMLDIYTVIEMIREMGQRLRNIQREMRHDLNMSIQKNLKAQANMQREAAWYQMIGGAVVGGVQLLATLATTGMQLKGLNKQAEMAKKMGADVAAKQLDMATVADNEPLAKAQLDKIKGKAPADIDTSKPLLESSERGNLKVVGARDKVFKLQQEIAGIETQKSDLQDKIASGNCPADKLEAEKAKIAELDKSSAAKESELEAAVKDYREKVGVDPEQTKTHTDTFKEKVAADRKELAEALKERDEQAAQLRELGGRSRNGDANTVQQQENYKEAFEAQKSKFDQASERLNKARGALAADFKDNSTVVGDVSTGHSISGEVKAARDKVAWMQQDLCDLEARRGALEDAVNSGKLSENELAVNKTRMENLNAASEAKGRELQTAVDEYNKLAEIDPKLVEEHTTGYNEEIARDKAELASAQDVLKEKVGKLKEFTDPERLKNLLPHEKTDNQVLIDKYQGEVAEAQKGVAKAREQLMNDYRSDSVAAKFDLAVNGKGQLEIHEAMLKEVDGYKNRYQQALDAYNGEVRVKGKASAQTTVELRDAKYRYQLARAEQVHRSSTFDAVTLDKHQETVRQLAGDLKDVNDRVDSGVRASNAERLNAYGTLISGVSNAVLGTFGQKVVEGLGQLKQAEITERQADEKVLEDQLDQVRDMFAQDGVLIQKAQELFQSVISKESQSEEEIINALKA